MGNLNILNQAEAGIAGGLQAIKLVINRAVQGPQQGQFYGSPVRLPGQPDGVFRQHEGETVISIPATFVPMVDPETNQVIPQIIKVRTNQGIREYDVTNVDGKGTCATASLTFTKDMLDELNDSDLIQAYVLGVARVTMNAITGHGRQGTFWVESPSFDFTVVPGEGPVAADTFEQVDAALVAGAKLSRSSQSASWDRRVERNQQRPANLKTREERAQQLKDVGASVGNMRDRATSQVGIPADQIASAPHPTMRAATQSASTSPTGTEATMAARTATTDLLQDGTDNGPRNPIQEQEDFGQPGEEQ